MGGRSIAHKARGEKSRRRMLKYSMSDIYKSAKPSKYPDCINTFQDCPTEITDPKQPPEQCKNCPQFKESKYYDKTEEQQKRVKELSELFANLRRN